MNILKNHKKTAVAKLSLHLFIYTYVYVVYTFPEKPIAQRMCFMSISSSIVYLSQVAIVCIYTLSF